MDKYPLARKPLAVGIILLFVGTCIIPSIAQDTEKPLPASRGNWLYVGGSGPGNYSTIRDAINNSANGDTIYVFAGTYHEAITVNVGLLTILGEGRDVTIIDANWTEAAVTIEKNFVSLRGFTIIGNKSGIYVQGELLTITISDNNLTQNYYGIEFQYDRDNYDNVIENNIFYSNHCGIYFVSDLWSNTIRNNTFIDNFNGMEVSGNNIRIQNNTFVNSRGSGLYLYGGPSLVEGNIFTNNFRGLYSGGLEQTITGNFFIGNTRGLEPDGSDQTITGNLFENNTVGVRMSGSNIRVNQNNFIQNSRHAWFAEENRSHGNNWDNNYWSDSFHLLGCMFIFGKMQTSIKKLIQFDPQGTSYYWIPWINVDRDPAQEPYDISGEMKRVSMKL
jgi:parallel beta-helix repeat protein